VFFSSIIHLHLSFLSALENFDDNVDMNRAWENVRENIRDSAKGGVGHYELHQHLGLMMNVQI
jgi:hypothetical protein